MLQTPGKDEESGKASTLRLSSGPEAGLTQPLLWAQQLLISSLLIGEELEGRRVFTDSQGVFWEGKSCPELLPLKRLSLLTQLKRS